mmetsp:Transcript_117747/g.313225  ORF Transcript_117747/g.313225 Transcript_117747/m.313225 type:complete len:214 (-) Transcript_117747:238-879(-)
MLLQLVCSFWTAIISLSMMTVGTESKDVPLSTSALQPSSHPSMTLFLVVLKALFEVCTRRKGLWRTHHVWRSLYSDSLSSSAWMKSSLLNASLALVIFTLQVCFPTTWTRTKLCDIVRWLVSFQMKNPSEPGSFPMHTEKDGEWKLSRIVRLSSIIVAMMVFVEAMEVMVLGGNSPFSSNIDTLWTTELALVQASDCGVSGGPRPMMLWKAAL